MKGLRVLKFLLRCLQVIYEKLGPAQKEAFLDIAAFLRGWDWRVVERVVGKPQLDTLVDQAMVSAKLKDAEGTSGIAAYTRYSERPWKSEMVVMHELLYAIACRRAAGNRVHSEDQTHLPERLKMDGPGMVVFSFDSLFVMFDIEKHVISIHPSNLRCLRITGSHFLSL